MVDAATLTAIAAILAAIGVPVASIWNGRTVRRTARKLEATAERTAVEVADQVTVAANDMNSRLEVIRVDVNSNMAKALLRIEALETALAEARGFKPPTL